VREWLLFTPNEQFFSFIMAKTSWGRRGFSTTYVISVSHALLMLWVRLPIRVRCTTLYDKVCQWLATGRWFSPGTPVSSTNKTDRHNIAEILLKMALSTIKPNQKQVTFDEMMIMSALYMTSIQSMDTSIRDFQYGGAPLQYMLITFLVITLKRQFG